MNFNKAKQEQDLQDNLIPFINDSAFRTVNRLETENCLRYAENLMIQRFRSDL